MGGGGVKGSIKHIANQPWLGYYRAGKSYTIYYVNLSEFKFVVCYDENSYFQSFFQHLALVVIESNSNTTCKKLYLCLLLNHESYESLYCFAI